tara:strand:- start:4932 stop:5930 length:999 start_codon:yes stop_codon:yes gene_type:complete
MEQAPILEVSELQVEFKTRSGVARVLDNIGFSLSSGETLGIVGESGCGKSMTSLSIMGLVPTPPGRIVGGTIRLNGEDLLKASEARMREIRGNQISMIFQEPMTALNPVFTVGDQIAETLILHEGLSKRDARGRAVEMLRAVKIPAPERRAHEYPHQLSGGMRQRVMIAMALACKPSVLIADEPTTALDVTVQAQVFELLKELQNTTNSAIILITHDMGVVAEVADRIAVMYAGRIIETATTEELLENPRHPYTQGLIKCVPHLDLDMTDEREALYEIPGVVPPLTQLGAGCAFAERCPEKMPKCLVDKPPGFAVNGKHIAACWLEEEGAHS